MPFRNNQCVAGGGGVSIDKRYCMFTFTDNALIPKGTKNTFVTHNSQFKLAPYSTALRSVFCTVVEWHAGNTR